jgi:ABC-type dipeptide/oligopeptide/nickel transport system permease subunit
MAGGSTEVSARTDEQGRDVLSALMYGARIR